jgi:hypothetical protein
MVELPDNEKLGLLAGGVLADAAFVFAEASESFSPKGKSVLFARISLTSTERWELMVIAESDLAKALAANLLGIDDDAEEAERSGPDALAEWTNIFAGSLAVECVSSQPFRIGLPTVTAEASLRASALMTNTLRRANLVTENGHHVAIGLRPLEAA